MRLGKKSLAFFSKARDFFVPVTLYMRLGEKSLAFFSFFFLVSEEKARL